MLHLSLNDLGLRFPVVGSESTDLLHCADCHQLNSTTVWPCEAPNFYIGLYLKALT